MSASFINVNRDRYIEEMKRYLAIPSISALPEHKGDVRKCAEWTAAVAVEDVDFRQDDRAPRIVGQSHLVEKMVAAGSAGLE